MDSQPPSLWRLNSRKKLLECPLFRIFEKRYVHPIDHRTGCFYTFDTADWVQVIALTQEKELLLVEQFRFGTEQLSIEPPGGLIDDKENPIDAAIRELHEETGYSGENPHYIASIYPNPAIQGNQLHIIAVENCKKNGSQHLDINEEIRCLSLPLAECLKKIRTGEINHGIAILSLLTYYFHKNEL